MADLDRASVHRGLDNYRMKESYMGRGRKLVNHCWFLLCLRCHIRSFLSSHLLYQRIKLKPWSAPRNSLLKRSLKQNRGRSMLLSGKTPRLVIPEVC